VQSVRELKNIKGQKVIVRVDFNVPIENNKVQDDFRIKKTLPTLKLLLEKGAELILLTHTSNPKQSLDPIKKHFYKISKFSKKDVKFFENVRKFRGEKGNSENFTKKLSALGEIYVNEAFSVSHRKHASIVSLPKLLPSYAGLQLQEEIKHLSSVFESPKHPFLFILGGAKISTKLPLIKKYLKVADDIFIGGALFNDFLEAQGFEVGKSLVDDTIAPPKNILQHQKFIFPADVLVKTKNGFRNKNFNQVGSNETIYDIGRSSLEIIESYIKSAKMILWNGPLGKYEVLDGGATKKIIKMVADSRAKTIVGGGDTVEIIHELGLEKKFTFVSTGGGAALEFLATGTLPGIKALK